jgi:hypothetical protein
MAVREDYIPYKDAEFHVWGNNFCAVVTKKTIGAKPDWTHIPLAEVELLTAAWMKWHTAYEAALVPHVPAQTLAKDEARKAAEAVIRPFVGQWLMWKQVADAEREEAGVHNKRPRRASIPAPTTVPALRPRAGNARELIIDYEDKGSTHRGKPPDVHGIEVRWAFLDKPPADIVAELANSAFDTKSPLILVFGEADRGKRIYMAGRWEIEREGIKGNFGDIETTIVP